MTRFFLGATGGHCEQGKQKMWLVCGSLYSNQHRRCRKPERTSLFQSLLLQLRKFLSLPESFTARVGSKLVMEARDRTVAFGLYILCHSKNLY